MMIPLYTQIVETHLGIKEGFLDTHKVTIHQKVCTTGWDMMLAGGEQQADRLFARRPDIFGINQCLHLASTVLLLGHTENALDRALEAARGVQFQDPTTVLTVAVLYYLMERERDMEPAEREAMTPPRPLEAPERVRNDKDGTLAIEYVCRRFKDACWMVGPTAAAELGFEGFHGA